MLVEKESKIAISGPAGNLETAVSRGDADAPLSSLNGVVVICHPHPQHGGTMDNKVVTTLMRTYRDLGVHVVRFNFRGVGQSEGVFDNAVGELDDLLAVIAWVKNNFSQSPILIAGFSFGSSIAARASYSVPGLVHLTLVAPPVERYQYDRDRIFNSPVCVVQGDQDERVIAQGVYDWTAQLRSPAELIRYPEAGHFFHGYLSALKTDLTDILLRQIPI
ncbi:alpha/beta hydrolase [Cellvibrio zantedeschiae]|uniref:Alpha/beta hydrolase n=1 Tax=Cellvibrio zantedeschiae TaxID=1237077 RepID=A0ABQ3AQW9_9GAMM|nr:alpha/beta fold hydrolase [Cellvibrio zantedeschiae]GGY63987.1 alpha/beta hydrolase [Cellvibrio zantedeschiae]